MRDEGRVERSVRRTSGFNTYLLTWAAIAAMSLGYLGVVSTRPELLANVLPIADHGDQVSSRNTSDMIDELTTLRKWVHDLQHDVAAAKSAIQESSSRQTELVQRLSAAEERLQGGREVRAEQSAPGVRSSAKIATRVVTRPEIPAVATPLPVAVGEPQPGVESSVATGVKVLNAGVTSPIATGSIVAPVAGPGRAPPLAGPRGIEIGSADSLDVLRSRWSELTEQQGHILKPLAPRYRISADGKQSPFTLMAGPFTNPAEAQRACANLRANGVTCRVGDYVGSTF